MKNLIWPQLELEGPTQPKENINKREWIGNWSVKKKKKGKLQKSVRAFTGKYLRFVFKIKILLSWWLWLCSRAWSQTGWFFQFHSSFSRLLWLFEVFLYFHTNCEIICSSSVKNTIGSLIGIALNLQIALGSILIFTILILLIHEHSIFLHLLVSSLISFTSVL